ncbi:uncharacterized protein METZ01_LOCUS142495 [marine metagenome]|uniref:Uncharacterized protein n=1 Tax=marine metagenome TaxID=408172 RepID=A0A381ZKZ5_9ZZZZ
MRQKTKTINCYKIDDEDLPEDLKEKILDKLRENSYDHWFAEDDILCEPEIFHGFSPTAWDIDRGSYIQFGFAWEDGYKLDPNDLRQWLELPLTTWEKVDYEFINDEYHNTKLEFRDAENGLELDEYNVNVSEQYDHPTIYPWDIKLLQEAVEKFDEMMDKALVTLREAHEYQNSDENMINMAESNDWEFDEDGEIV